MDTGERVMWHDDSNGRGWSVRAHLGAIFVVVVAASLAAWAYANHQARDAERGRAAERAGTLAARAARALEGQVGLAADQVGQTAANPTVATVLAGTLPCRLNFDLGLFQGSHLDVVRPDGAVACSSVPDLPPGQPHAGAPWLAELAPGSPIRPSEPFTDGLTGRPAVAVAAPVTAAGAVAGAVVAVLPVDGLADRIADHLQETRPYRYAVVDLPSGAPLSVSSALGDVAGQPLAGRDHLHRAAAVAGSTWEVRSGIAVGPALAPARDAARRGLLAGAVALAVLGLSLAVVGRRIGRPLRRLAGAVSTSGPNADEVLLGVGGPREVRRLGTALEAARAAREEYEERLAHQALHDPLTGLPNRVLLADRLAHALQQAQRSEHHVAVLFLDLDRFKLVNDSLGHGTGDELLAGVAKRLSAVLRPADTLARFGGDEFVVVAEGIERRAEAEVLAQRLLDAASAPLEHGDDLAHVSASIGIALSEPGSDAHDLLRDADAAMYLAKERGGAGYAVFGSELHTRASHRLAVEHDLRRAVEGGQLQLAFQPKYDLGSGDLVGAEALVRWHHPERGVVPPAAFIPVAEETGLILPLGRFVLGEACRQAAAWRAEGYHVPVAVNVSGRQVADPQLVRSVAAVLDESGLPAGDLCLELTESVLMIDTMQTAKALAGLGELGVRLSVDDFGTGYSSLGYLHRFPVDELKIDRSFVSRLTDGRGQHTLVAAMVAMADALGLEVVAEGVETEEQAATLRALGCPTAQGYLFAPPRPAADFAPLLRSARQLVDVR